MKANLFFAKADLKNVKAFSGKDEKPFNFFKMQKYPSNKSVEANLLIHNTNSWLFTLNDAQQKSQPPKSGWLFEIV